MSLQIDACPAAFLRVALAPRGYGIMGDALKKFGKFFLLDMIAQGGMAEIYRARMAMQDGGGRLLAIKRIIGNYTEQKEFVEMFKSEIKTMSGFTHPNIISLYDYGEESGMLYIAMELVDGKNLRQFMSRFSELKQAFPTEVAVYIMEQAAHGMAYAHSYKDKITGKPLNIVHRDISPQNIMISYDGAVKVFDFGIAKANTNAESTRAGVIKGKPSYLSPEQITGDPLDGRSDIFALGIVLWELLTGRKLFASDNDYGVLKLIENCQNTVKPPSMFNPKVPKDLDAIVMKALTKNRDQRYQTSEELQRALHKFLYQFAPEFNPADLAYYARDLFKNEIVEDRKRLLKLNEKAELLLAQPEPEPAKPAPAPAAKPESTTVVNKAPAAEKPAQAPAPTQKRDESGSFRTVEFKEKTDVHLDFGAMGKAQQQTGKTPAATSSGSKPIQYATSSMSTNLTTRRPGGGTATGLRRRPGSSETKKSPLVAVAAAVVALAGVYYVDPTFFGLIPGPQTGGSNPGSTAQQAGPVGTLVIQSNVQAATIKINDEPRAQSLPATIANVPAGKPVRITVFSNGYKIRSETVTLASGETSNLMLPLEIEGAAGGAGDANAPATTNVMLKVGISPPGVGSTIRINGALVDASGLATVPTEREVELTVERDGFRTYREKFTLHASDLAGRKEASKEVALQPAKFGFISIKTTPRADAVVSIDGAEEKWSTPVSRKRIPVGTYKVKLVNSLLGMEKEITFTVGEDRFTNIDERLQVNDAQRTPGSQQ